MAEKRKLPVDPFDVPISKTLRLADEFNPNPAKIVFEKLSLSFAYHGNAVYLELITDKDNDNVMEQNFMAKPSEPLKFIEAAVNRVMKVLQNPNLHLKQLVIDLESPTSTSRKNGLNVPLSVHLQFNKAMEHLLTLLCSKLLNLPFKLSVYHFKMEFDWRQEEVFKLLSIMQPVTLKKISLISSFLVIDTDKIVELEQWKRAEELEWICETGMDLEHWKHFRRVDIHWERPTKQQMDAVFENFLCSTTLKYVSISFLDAETFLKIYFKRFQLAEELFSIDNRFIRVVKPDQLINFSIDNGKLVMWRERPPIVKKPDAHPLAILDTYNGSTYEQLTISQNPSYQSILITLIIDKETQLKLELEPTPAGYRITNLEDGFEWPVSTRNEFNNTFVTRAIDLVLKICKDNIVIKKLIIDKPGYSFCEGLREILDEDERRLKVEHFKIIGSKASLLAHLQPGTLKIIEVPEGLKFIDFPNPRLFQSELWSRAEQLITTDELPVRLWKHFRRVQVSWGSGHLEEVATMLETLLASPSWEVVKITLPNSRIAANFHRRCENETFMFGTSDTARRFADILLNLPSQGAEIMLTGDILTLFRDSIDVD